MADETPEPEPVSPVGPPLRGQQVMHQRWRDVVFLHWRVDADRVRPLLPDGTTPDVCDGSSWVGLVAVRLEGSGLWRAPGVPWLGSFPEVNVRLYSVDRTGRRGVVFLSMDAARLAVVLGARAALGLPYCWARMTVRREGGAVEYEVRRRWPGPNARARVAVRPEEPGQPTVSGNALTDFLTARWGLHVRRAGRLVCLPLIHERWPLQTARVDRLDGNLVAAAGLPGVADGEPKSVLWSPGVSVAFGLPYDAGRPRR